MTAEEFRDKEAITDANFWNGNEIDFDAIFEFAEAYAKQEIKELEIYKKVWMQAASLFDENGLAMPKDLMFKNFANLDKEILKWKIGYEQIKELEDSNDKIYDQGYENGFRDGQKE